MSVKRVLLIGLDPQTVEQLSGAACTDEYHFLSLQGGTAGSDALTQVFRFRPDLICLPPETESYAPLLNSLTGCGLKIPFAVVSRKPDPQQWRRALEQGAAEYFSPPFRAGEVDLILASAASASPMGAYLSVAP